MAFTSNQEGEVRDLGDKAACLKAESGAGRHTFIAHSLRGEGFDASEDGTGIGTPLVPVVAGSVTTHHGIDASAAWTDRLLAQPKFGVRRLMPVECERCQGMPDHWTRYGIDDKGNEYELSDSARYRLIGNSVAVPNVEWIGRRIVAASEQH